MAILDVSRRSTFYKQKRARAYDFPLDAVIRGGRPATSTRSETGEQQRREREDGVREELQPMETWGSESDASDRSDGGEWERGAEVVSTGGSG